MSLPKLITPADLASHLDDPKSPKRRDRWSTQRASRWLQSSGAGIKVGGRWLTTLQRLRAHFGPAAELFELANVDLYDCDDDDEGEGDGCISCLRSADRIRALEGQVTELGARLLGLHQKAKP